MSQPSIYDVANMYLYGQITTPEEKGDDQFIRVDNSTSNTSINVDLNEYMTQGAGRFALGNLFELVARFFESTPTDGAQPGSSYTKSDYAALLGLTDYGLNLRQKDVQDSVYDYAERTFVWNSMRYKISDSAVFKVNEDGMRVIENFYIQPIDDDNFDFTSLGITDVFNNLLEALVDPWGIGREVALKFTWSLQSINYTLNYYISDVNTHATWTIPSYIDLLADMTDVSNSLWEAGVTKFLDSDVNRPVFAGDRLV